MAVDRAWAALAAGTAACVLGLAGIGLSHGGPTHVEERGLAAIEMDGSGRIVGVRSENLARVLVEVSGAPPVLVADVASGADEWVEGETEGDGRPWAGTRIHMHPARR